MAAAFRAATSSDVDAIVALVHDYYRTEHYAFDEPAARRAVEALAADAALGRLWVADDGGAVVGYLAVTFGWSLEYQGRDAFVDELYVAPSHRGRGLGRTAMTLAEDACRAADVRALHLEVEPENTIARELYRRRGFADHERILMTKRLTPLR
jgi:ribosomal protein S18 acetylase RimI-like enzyme